MGEPTRADREAFAREYWPGGVARGTSGDVWIETGRGGNPAWDAGARAVARLRCERAQQLTDAEQAGYERGKREAETSHTSEVAAMLFEIERYIENASSTTTLFASYRKAHGIVDDGVPPWTK